MSPSSCLRMQTTFTCAGVLTCCSSVLAADINVPGDFRTIQAAVDAASNGDVISVAVGLFEENITISGKSLTIRGMGVPELTTIAAADAEQPVIEITLTDQIGPVTFEGLTISGGRGGLNLNFADVQIGDCIIRENFGAPGIDAFWSDLQLDRCHVIENGGSESVSGGIYASLSTVSLHHATIESNRGLFGGGLHMTECFVSLDSSSVMDNEAEDGGGLFAPTSIVSIVHTNLSENRAANDGGAIVAVGGDLSVLSSSIEANKAIRGGGVMIDDTSLATISQTTVIGNSASLGGGIWLDAMVSLDIAMSTFCHNSPEHIVGEWNDLGENLFDTCDLNGDLNGDGIVNVSDVLILLGAWGPCPDHCPADLNDDGVVDAIDLLILLEHWS